MLSASRQQFTQYTYDAYGRLSEVQYYQQAGGSEYTNQRVTYFYDNTSPYGTANPRYIQIPNPQNSLGLLSGVAFGGGVTDAYDDSYYYVYGYNTAGRVTTQDMSVIGGSYSSYNNIGFSATYQWDDEGRMTSLEYPTVYTPSLVNAQEPGEATMPTAGYQYDINGRLSGITMNSGSGPQALASATYNAAGQLQTLSWGPWTESRTYNSLGQLTNQAGSYLNMTYNYSATQNNGRITGSVDGVTGESTSYTYDALNRLSAASNSLWSQSYTYDGFGNLLTKSQANGSPNPSPSLNVTYNANNQQNGLSYDANGNQLSLPICGTACGNTYNVENRLVWQNLGGWPGPVNEYAYDPWGKRVMSGSDPAPGAEGSQPNYTYTFYGITGQRLATLNCNGDYPGYPTCTITGQNVYLGKKLIVSGGVPVETDRLGSVRADTQGESMAYYPFGEERTSTVDGRNKFGTYFRDTIGQDYAGQRYYGSATGRFWTVDPGGMATVHPGNPTSWNRYAYVNGDPINFGDPSGKDPNCGPNMVWDGEGCTNGAGGSLPDASVASSVNLYAVSNSPRSASEHWLHARQLVGGPDERV